MPDRPDIPAPPRRRYDSSRRQEQAAATRTRMLRVAEEQFTEHGFGVVTMADIAAEAHVSVPTLYATFGSKTQLLATLLTGLEDRADAAAWRDRIDAEPDPRARITGFVHWSRQLYENGAGLIRAAHQAADDPAVTELRREGDRRRRAGLRELVNSLADDAALVPRRPDAVDRAFVLTGPALYLSCTDDCGWAPRRYQQWLSRLLTTELLGPAQPNRSAATCPT